MTNRTLSRIVLSVVLLYSGAFVLGAVLYAFSRQTLYPAYKDLIPFIIAVPAAYLGFCFQRRSSYLQALRDLWKSLIPAVQRAIQYTSLEQPDPKEFGEVVRDLSTMIDSLRGVFRNIPSRGSRTGFYPYEPLKEILQIMSWLRDGRSPDERYRARRCMRQLWSDMHSSMLHEFDREVPGRPVSKYLDGEDSVADKLRKGTLTDGDFRQ